MYRRLNKKAVEDTDLSFSSQMVSYGKTHLRYNISQMSSGAQNHRQCWLLPLEKENEKAVAASPT